MSKTQILDLVRGDKALMEILTIIENLVLPEACLCAGAIRNTVWNHLSGKSPELISDVDVIFFDPTISYEETQKLEVDLQQNYPKYQWELKNQIYMHHHHPGAKPYSSVMDGLKHFPENCTAIAVRKRGSELELIAPYGVSELLNFEVRPTPLFQEDGEKLKVYQQRVSQKNWAQHWPDLKIFLN